MIEYPTGQQFLNQHGDISIFSDGFTAMERKYLKFLLLRMSVQADNIADIVVKSISKKDLHKVSLYFLILLNFSPEILNMIIIKSINNALILFPLQLQIWCMRVKTIRSSAKFQDLVKFIRDKSETELYRFV